MMDAMAWAKAIDGRIDYVSVQLETERAHPNGNLIYVSVRVKIGPEASVHASAGADTWPELVEPLKDAISLRIEEEAKKKARLIRLEVDDKDRAIDRAARDVARKAREYAESVISESWRQIFARHGLTLKEDRILSEPGFEGWGPASDEGEGRYQYGWALIDPERVCEPGAERTSASERRISRRRGFRPSRSRAGSRT